MFARKIILLELNEVPFRIIDEYSRHHPNSYLAQCLPRCYQHETYAEDSILSPWITWPTVHRGVSDRKHFIHHFGQDLTEADKEFPPIWKILSSQGIKSGIFGPLHSYPMSQDLEHYDFYVPDTFAAGSECFPMKLSVFQEFNLSMARRSSRNVEKQVPWKLALRLLANLPHLGLKTGTLMDTGQQVLCEQVKPWRRARRRTYQVLLAFDIFMKQLRLTKPAFSTFFTNHVASSMHRYWAAAFPGDYEVFGYDAEWVSTYRHEIDFTMSKADSFFTQLARFADQNPEYILLMLSSMGQAATTAEPVETQLYATDVVQFMDALGIPSDQWSQRPAMAPEISVYVADQKLGFFRSALDNLIIDDRPIHYDEREKGFFSISFGQENLFRKPSYAVLNGVNVPFEQLGLSNMRIEDKTNTNAYHIPTGSLIIYDPKDRSPKLGRTQISTVEIAPAILQNFSVKAPGYMSTAPKLMSDK